MKYSDIYDLSSDKMRVCGEEVGLAIVSIENVFTVTIALLIGFRFWLNLEQAFYCLLDSLLISEEFSETFRLLFPHKPFAIDAAFNLKMNFVFDLQHQYFFNTADWGDLMSEIKNSDLYRTRPSMEDRV